MKNLFRTLRVRLLAWYIASLAVLGVFIIETIHIIQYRYSVELIILLFFILASVGSLIIYRFTGSLSRLSSQIRQINSRNLDKRITAGKGNDEIGELASSFNGLLDRLDTAFKRERQFIADVAHEMKTPIATLRSSFEVTLQKERTNEEYKQIIRESIRETDRITNTLKDVLDLAWSEVPHEKSRSHFDLSQQVEELAEITEKLGMAKKVKVTCSVAQGVYVHGFRERLGRAILNILDNAVKYSYAGGQVHIALEREKDKAIISVKDSGQGIREEEIGHIFARFYRGSKTDREFGAGLGLAISKSTVENHKGTIRVVSRPGRETVFFIMLPAES